LKGAVAQVARIFWGREEDDDEKKGGQQGGETELGRQRGTNHCLLFLDHSRCENQLTAAQVFRQRSLFFSFASSSNRILPFSKHKN